MADTRLRLTIEADAAKAEADLKEIQGYADRLEQDDLDLVVKVRTEAAEANIKALRKKLADVSDEGDVKVVLQGIDKAQSELRELQNLAEKPASKKFSLDGIKEGASGLADMAGSAEALPGPLGAAAGFLSGPAGIAGMAAAAGAGMVSLATSAADAAADAEALSAAVGGTTEETSRLLAATKSVGLDYMDLLELISESNGAINDNEEAARNLGVAIQGTPIERFQQLVDSVYQIEDPMKRAQLASKFFGEEGSKQLPRLIGMYGDLSTAIDAVPDSAVISEKDAAAAKEFSLAIAEFKTQVGVLASTIGKALLPIMTEMAEGATDAAGFFEKAGSQASDAWSWVSDPSYQIKRSFFSEGEKGAEDYAATLEVASGVVDGFFGKTKEAEAALAAQATSQELVNAQVEEYTGYQAEAKEGLDNFLESVYKQREVLMTTAEAQMQAVRTSLDLADAIKEAGKEGGITRDETESLNDQTIKLAEYQVKAAGETETSTRGQAIYNKSLLNSASALGNTLTPEILDYIAISAKIPPEVVTDIKALLEAGKFDEASARLKAIDETIAVPEVNPTYDSQPLKNAKTDADNLDGRSVDVKVNVDTSVLAAANRALDSFFGRSNRAASTAAATARYQNRNGVS